MAKSQYIYSVQGLDGNFDTKEEAFRQAHNLVHARHSVNPKAEGIWVYRYGRVNNSPDQIKQKQAPFYVYNGQTKVTKEEPCLQS
jgi:hypothetical protein